MWDVLSGVAEVAWDVLSGVAKMTWDVLSGVTKTARDVLSGWQIDAGCFVRDAKKWHGMFCPGMFCPTFNLIVHIEKLVVDVTFMHLPQCAEQSQSYHLHTVQRTVWNTDCRFEDRSRHFFFIVTQYVN